MIPRRSIAPIACIMLAVGCRTVPFPEPYLIDIPTGMTQQQLRVAIVAGILNSHPPADYDPMAELSEEEFNALLWQRFVGTARSRGWFPESREGDTIYASVNTRGLYLRAAIERGPEQLRVSIVESRNLSEGGGRIHKRAVAWLRNLEAHIRREVGRMSLIVGRAA